MSAACSAIAAGGLARGGVDRASDGWSLGLRPRRPHHFPIVHGCDNLPLRISAGTRESMS
ncbi:hypothetical protein E2562_027928 [Oryza meyeriana var. granulata]|uniref:Uncharacterized protein n=1 Tax=Oryza meyeriana var. granulata TaxID=110450 RepID=A0A6G1EZK3_9ORYZ|nr:hypothetical protein E2562_027928 [Oryza meyeriana var. granulata]